MDKVLLEAKCRQLCILFAFGVLGGCIYFNILWLLQGDIFRNEWSILFDHWIKIPLKEYILYILDVWYIFYMFHILVCIAGGLKIGKIMIQGIFLCLGIGTGSAQTLLLLSFDLKTGMVFGLKILIILFPYILVIGSTMILSCAMSSLRWISKEKTTKWKKIQWKRYCIGCFMTLFFHLVYIILLSYVNYEKINLFFIKK